MTDLHIDRTMPNPPGAEVPVQAQAMPPEQVNVLTALADQISKTGTVLDGVNPVVYKSSRSKLREAYEKKAKAAAEVVHGCRGSPVYKMTELEFAEHSPGFNDAKVLKVQRSRNPST